MSMEVSNWPLGSGEGSSRPTWFQITPPAEPAPVAVGGAPRFQRANRRQARMIMSSLDAMLADDHQARVVWEYVEGLDLACLYDSIRAVEGGAGRGPLR